MQFAFLALRQDHLGVAHHPDMPDLLIVGAVVDEHCEIDAYLSGGKADAFSGVHGGKHVTNEVQQFVVERGHGTSGSVQD